MLKAYTDILDKQSTFGTAINTIDSNVTHQNFQHLPVSSDITKSQLAWSAVEVSAFNKRLFPVTKAHNETQTEAS